MRKVLVYWIQITDHGRCDEPRDHIWHTLDRYHSLDRGPGSDKNGIKTMLSNIGNVPNVLLQAGVILLPMLCRKYLLCHLFLFFNSLSSFYIIFNCAFFGRLAVAMWLETEQWSVQGSPRRHFLALVCANWISFKWEDACKQKVILNSICELCLPWWRLLWILLLYAEFDAYKKKTVWVIFFTIPTHFYVPRIIFNDNYLFVIISAFWKRVNKSSIMLWGISGCLDFHLQLSKLGRPIEMESNCSKWVNSNQTEFPWNPGQSSKTKLSANLLREALQTRVTKFVETHCISAAVYRSRDLEYPGILTWL